MATYRADVVLIDNNDRKVELTWDFPYDPTTDVLNRKAWSNLFYALKPDTVNGADSSLPMTLDQVKTISIERIRLLP